MMKLTALCLIVLIVGINFRRPVHTSKVTGKLLHCNSQWDGFSNRRSASNPEITEMNLVNKKNQWTSALPCSDKTDTTWRMKQKPIYALLCRKKKMIPADQLWSGELTLPNGVIPVPEGTFLVEREKDLSSYNWNSFGLRYGKRESGTVKSKVKI
ncbi:PREDICTED: metastasis-suppressor KiSS-1 [Nanorana parkeri]|uniref:metastasis-suppressor KiSS-1 n=1 Tax=Nanorana parkeri TaxID=125878 RepID=UPI000854E4BC|nr:PREDICTED: metastasis-suppressor KiSS-1 [Nanorana parkeri]